MSVPVNAALFRKAWQRLSGVAEMKVTALSVVLALVGAFLTSYILAHAIIFASAYLKTGGNRGSFGS